MHGSYYKRLLPSFSCLLPRSLFVSTVRKMSEAELREIHKNLRKKVMKEGKFGRKPSLGWTCCIIVSDEREANPESVEITIGNGCSAEDRLIELCVESMHLEEKSFFVLMREKDTLKMHVVLKSYTEKPYIFQWTEVEKLEACEFYKAKGLELFKENKVEEAFYKFSIALKFTLLLDSVLEMDEQNEMVTNLRTALYNNLAGCHLHFKNYSSVVKLCSDSLSLQKTVKAYFRRAVANIELREYEKAEEDLVELLKLEPKNKAALEKYQLVRELDRPNRENYKSVVTKMFL